VVFPAIEPKEPYVLWKKHEDLLIEDYVHQYRNAIPLPTRESHVNRALWHLSVILEGQGKSLRDYPPMPIPTRTLYGFFWMCGLMVCVALYSVNCPAFVRPVDNFGVSQMMWEELNYNHAELRERVASSVAAFTLGYCLNCVLLFLDQKCFFVSPSCTHFVLVSWLLSRVLFLGLSFDGRVHPSKRAFSSK
jgi:hypothetical protein